MQSTSIDPRPMNMVRSMRWPESPGEVSWVSVLGVRVDQHLAKITDSSDGSRWESAYALTSRMSTDELNREVMDGVVALEMTARSRKNRKLASVTDVRIRVSFSPVG